MVKARLRRWSNALRKKLGLVIPEGHWSHAFKGKLGLTYTTEGMRRFGGPFLTTFSETVIEGRRGQFIVSLSRSKHESPVSVALLRGTGSWGKSKVSAALKLAEARLGFKRNAVVVEAIQGLTDPSVKPGLNAFRRATKKPWANYLVEKVEEHARRMGYGRVLLTRPERLMWYKAPLVPGKEIPMHLTGEARKKFVKKKQAEIRARMKALYEAVANALGYRRKWRFFVKDL